MALVPTATPTGTTFSRENEAVWWTLYVNRASNKQCAWAGIGLLSPEGHRLNSAIHLAFEATKNAAEYEALIAGLQLAK